MDREAWNERYRAAPVLWQVDPGPFLGAEVGSREPGTALDLGAGEGRNSLWLAERGWRVTAVDLSDVAVAKGRERAAHAGVGDSITWLTEDVVDLQPPPDAYDLVL